MNIGPDSTGCVTLKQSINLSEPQCLHLSQSGYTSTCPRVVLLSEETRHRNVETASEETVSNQRSDC